MSSQQQQQDSQKPTQPPPGGVQVKQEHRSASEVVRAPLAVPMAHQGGRSAGFATMPRLGSLRATPDLSLGGPAAAPKPAFAPLIPNARSHSRKMFVTFTLACGFLSFPDTFFFFFCCC